MGLFLSPWFLEFDPNTFSITKMSVWVRLSLHFWQALEDIGNVLGKFLKADQAKEAAGLRSFARFYTEINLSKGLPDKIILKLGNIQHFQILDYENTAFRCHICRTPGHLQAVYPQAKKNQQQMSSSNKGGWNNPSPNTARKSDHKEDFGAAHPANSGNGSKNQVNMAPSNRAEENRIVIGGVKRGHESDKSDKSDSDQEQSLDPSNNHMLVVASDQYKWHEVRKKKGKKGQYANLLDYYSSNEER
ncbi:hypothetical protein KI387_035985, partial [Taxus chinensis]